MVVFTNVRKEQLNFLLKENFEQEEPKTIYEELRLRRNKTVLILYTSGKLLLQGEKNSLTIIAEKLEKKGVGKIVKTQHFRKEVGIIIGSDESLKGDTFGGLVVAAVKADTKIRQELLKLGVADSKKLADKEILTMAKKIRNIATCEIRSILPEEYNKDGKVTNLLNKLHFQVAQGLRSGNSRHVVDLYPGCNVGDIQETKAESKYLEVAAASVIARATALQQLDYLSGLAGFTLPKGSTHVHNALVKLLNSNKDLNKFVKLNFSNVKDLL